MCVCVCVRIFVTYEGTNLYNDMGMTQVLQGEGDLWGNFPIFEKAYKSYRFHF